MPQVVQRAVTQAVRAKNLTNAKMYAERTNDSPTMRALKIASHRTAGEIMVAVLGRVIDAPEYMGAGVQQAVFVNRQKNFVRKILFESIGLDIEQAEALAATHQANFDRAVAYLGDFYVPTKFQPQRLPGLLGGSAVTATQPILRPFASFAHPNGIWEYSDDEHYINEQRDIHRRIGDMYGETGMFPDLYGEGNVMVIHDDEVGEHLRMPDTIPETPETGQSPMWTDQPNRPETRKQIFEQLHKTWQTQLAA